MAWAPEPARLTRMTQTGSSAAPRAVRVAAQVQRSLALLLQRGLRDPRVGNVTVTTVTVVPDLTVAHVRVLPFASARAGEETLAGLRSAAGYLRGEVARELKLRRAPRLEFELDVELERAHHVSELIDEAVRADRTAERLRAEREVPRKRPVATARRRRRGDA